MIYSEWIILLIVAISLVKNVSTRILMILNISAKRPPVEETKNFLKSLMASHGPNYLEKLFGHKARDSLEKMGGVDKVSISLSGQSLKIANCDAIIFLQHQKKQKKGRQKVAKSQEWR